MRRDVTRTSEPLDPEVTHMARIGYARVSSTDQNLALQIERLKAAGCEMVRSEKVTGSTRQGRSELASIITFLRPGDELVVTRIDRLARSIGDLQDIVREVKAKGAHSLRRTSGASASLRASPRRRRRASTRAANPALTVRPCRPCTAMARVRPEIAKALGISRMHA